jgi:hypothetical protein
MPPIIPPPSPPIDDEFITQQRKRLEQETIRNERKSNKIVERYGKPTVIRMTDAEIEYEAKLRKHFPRRNYRPCNICGGSNGSPTFFVNYHLKGIVKVERYCDVCIKKIDTS